MYISGSPIGANDLGNTSPTFIVSDPSLASDYSLDEQSFGYHAGSDGNNIGVVNAQTVGSVIQVSGKPAKVIDFKR